MEIKMKRIGFFGHSNCAYRSSESLVDLLANFLESDIVNIGVRQGSEERILYELKKTKDLDLAVIFHSEPQYIFLPGCDRDVGINNVNEFRAEYMFKDWTTDFSKQHHAKFLEKFKNSELFVNAVSILREYFYHPDLQMNRFIGSLLQIDHYVQAKNIPVIHVIKEQILPQWFKFSSGVVDFEIMKLVDSNAVPRGKWFVNCVTAQGNELIFKKLKELVVELNPPSLGAIA